MPLADITQYGWVLLASPVVMALVTPFSIWINCRVLRRSAKASDGQINEWAMKRVDRQPVADLVRAIRRQPTDQTEDDDDGPE